MHPLPNRNPLPFLYLFTHLLIPSRLNFRLPLLLHPPSTPLLCHYLSSSFHSPSPTLPYLSPSPLLHSDPILFPASPSLQLPISWSSTPNSNRLVIKTFEKNSRPRPRPWPPGLETKTKTLATRSRDQDQDLGHQV